MASWKSSVSSFAASLLIHAAILGAFASMRNEHREERKPTVTILFEAVKEAVAAEPDERPTAPPPSPTEEIQQDIPATETQQAIIQIAPPEPEAAPPEPEIAPPQPAAAPPPTPAAAEIERAHVEAEPVALNKIAPVYPRSARRKGHEGNVTVEMSIAADGSVRAASIVSSSGHAELDAAALAAARKAKFALPGSSDGATLRTTFEFKISN